MMMFRPHRLQPASVTRREQGARRGLNGNNIERAKHSPHLPPPSNTRHAPSCTRHGHPKCAAHDAARWQGRMHSGAAGARTSSSWAQARVRCPLLPSSDRMGPRTIPTAAASPRRPGAGTIMRAGITYGRLVPLSRGVAQQGPGPMRSRTQTTRNSDCRLLPPDAKPRSARRGDKSRPG